MNDLKKGKNILIVEDEAIIALGQTKQLERYGYNVNHVFTGDAAVKAGINEELKTDLILMDIDLGSGIDGTEAARQILEKKDIPIVFLSSHAEPEIVEKTEKITSYGYVVKNSGATILDASIKMAFKLYEEKIRVQEKHDALSLANEKLNLANKEILRQDMLLNNKIEKMFNPDTDVRELELSEIIDIKSVQSLLEKLYTYTGMVTALLDLKGNILISTGWQNICTMFYRINKTTAGYCTESDLHLSKELKPDKFIGYKCKNGLWDVVTPLFIGEKHVGNIYTGQFFYDDDIVDEEFFLNQADKFGFDKNRFLKALHDVPRYNKETINNLMSFLVDFFKLVSRLSYSNLVLAKVSAKSNIS